MSMEMGAEIANLKAEVASLTADRDRLIEKGQAAWSERDEAKDKLAEMTALAAKQAALLAQERERRAKAEAKNEAYTDIVERIIEAIK